jgi:hypothetical protein
LVGWLVGWLVITAEATQVRSGCVTEDYADREGLYCYHIQIIMSTFSSVLPTLLLILQDRNI